MGSKRSTKECCLALQNMQAALASNEKLNLPSTFPASDTCSLVHTTEIQHNAQANMPERPICRLHDAGQEVPTDQGWSIVLNHLVALAHHNACLCAMHDASAMCQLNYGAAAISLTNVVQQAMAMSAGDAGSSPVDIAMACCCTLRGSAESIPECTLAASLSARCNSVMRITASSIRAPAWCLKGLRF